MAIQTVADLVARSTTSSPTVTSGQYRQERENVMASIGLEKAKQPDLSNIQWNKPAPVAPVAPKEYFAQTSIPEVKPQGQGQSPFSGSNIAPPRTDYATGISDAERSRTGMGRQVSAEDRTNDVLGLVRQGLTNPQELQRYLNVNQAGGLASGYTEAEIARIIQENQDAVTQGQQYRQQAVAGGATPQTLEEQAQNTLANSIKERQDRFNVQQKFLNTQFDRLATETQAAQRSEAGSANLQLARMGAFTAASGVDYSVKLQARQRDELVKLEEKRFAALQAAEDAYKEDELKRAEELTKEARELRKEARETAADYRDRLADAENLKKLRKDNASSFFKDLVDSGKSIEDLPEDYLADQFPDLDEVSARSLFGAHKKEQDAKKIDEDLKKATLDEKNYEKLNRPIERQKALMDIQASAQNFARNTLDQTAKLQEVMAKWPKGVPLQIGDASFMGIDGGAIFEASGDGIGRLLYKDENGKDAVMNMEFIGDPADLITEYHNGVPVLVNKKTRMQAPITRGVPGQQPDAAIGWEKYFPTDSVGGQCGAFVHSLVDGYPKGLNKIEEKKTAMNVPKGSIPRVGDVVIQDVNTEFGHVAVVNWVGPGANGETIVRLTESNYNSKTKPEKVSHTRPLSINDPSIAGYFRGTLRPGLEFGTDVPRQEPAPTTDAAAAGTPTTAPASENLTFSQSPFTKGTLSEAQFNAANEKEQSAREAAMLVADKTSTFEEATKGLPAAVINRTKRILEENKVDTKATAASIEVPDFNTFARDFEREVVKKGAMTSINEAQLKTLYEKTVKPMPAYVAAAEQLALDLAGEKKGPQFIADVRKLVENGDFSRAQDRLKKVALDTVDTTTAQQIRGRDTAIRALNNISVELEAYRTKYKDMNILSGTAEQIKNKIGKVKNADQKRIATKIAAALADYRKAISGAAFTESEKADYESMFPSIMNEEKLNTANIQGMTETFSQANESFYRQQLGNENYDLIFQP